MGLNPNQDGSNLIYIIFDPKKHFNVNILKKWRKQREAGMVCLNLVSFLEILSPTIKSNSSKSVGDRRVKFLNPMASSSLNLSNKFMPNVGPSSNSTRHHHRFLFLDFSPKTSVKHELTPHKAISSMTAKLQLSENVCSVDARRDTKLRP